ncbi:MAG TPA: hypothetical protein VFG72_15495 [Marmoricola sp.]|nr:hypothetical protein [Marmoricola sp.]
MHHPADGPVRRQVAEPRWRSVVTSPAVAAVAVTAIIAGATTAAAADWLPIFRTEQVAPVPVSHRELVALPDLTGYGKFRLIEEPDVREVPDAAIAEDATGLEAPEVADLPRGVIGEPSYLVGGRARAEFTFSADRAKEAATATGEAVPPVPEGLDASTFRITAGPGVAAVWSSNSDVPALAVARVVAPTAESTGVKFATARDYLLSLPGIPTQLAERLRDFSGDGTMLPLLVPADAMESSTTDVEGNPATLLTSRDGAMAGVVWVEDGTVTAVAGSLSADEVLAVARELQAS